MTSIALIPAAPVEEKLDALTRQVEQLTQALETTITGAGAVWLPRRRLAERFGMSPRSATIYIASAITEGRLRNFRPTDASGNAGHPLYHVADFEAYISRNPTTATVEP